MIDSAKLIRYLPHSQPMLLLSEVLSIDEQMLQATSLIEPENPFLENRLFPCAAAIEVVAQAAGVLFTYTQKQTRLKSDASKQQNNDNNQHSQSGAVVQLKTFELGDAEIHVGSELKISVNFIGGSDKAILVSGDVCMNEHMIFKGTLMIALFKDKPNGNS